MLLKALLITIQDIEYFKYFGPVQVCKLRTIYQLLTISNWDEFTESTIINHLRTSINLIKEVNLKLECIVDNWNK